LAKFNGGERQESSFSGINFYLKDYLELVDYSGRAIREDKTGHIDNNLPAILNRLSIPQERWFENCQQFEALYRDRFAPKMLFTT